MKRLRQSARDYCSWIMRTIYNNYCTKKKFTMLLPLFHEFSGVESSTRLEIYSAPEVLISHSRTPAPNKYINQTPLIIITLMLHHMSLRRWDKILSINKTYINIQSIITWWCFVMVIKRKGRCVLYPYRTDYAIWGHSLHKSLFLEVLEPYTKS